MNFQKEWSEWRNFYSVGKLEFKKVAFKDVTEGLFLMCKGRKFQKVDVLWQKRSWKNACVTCELYI